MENHNWYAVITAKVLLDKRLSSTQKLMVALIANLSNERGYCFASNRYLGECLDISQVTVQQNIAHLEDLKIISRVFKVDKAGNETLRALTVIEVLKTNGEILKTIGGGIENNMGGYIKNNTIITNSTNNKEEKGVPPLKSEAEHFFVSCGGSRAQGEKFWLYYQARGWKNISDWTALAQKWFLADNEKAPGKKPVNVIK